MFKNFFTRNKHKEAARENPPLYLHNTLHKEKELFVPSNKRFVSMYTCGPTVYAEQHIGNMRPPIISSVLRNILEYNGYKVKQVINITDVGHLTDDGNDGEDKIEAGAKKEGKTSKEIASTYTDQFINDLRSLNVPVDKIEFPKATNYIGEQIAFIQTLEEKGFAYTTSDGVYFDTARFPNYGALGGIDLESLAEGARVEKNSEKRNPTDFALWKFSPQDTKREQEWESPWGNGFPGWHIECSAMSRKLLGRTIDIHMGGIEHIPVHHNNEIAQSETANGSKFVRFWLHFAHIMLEGRKISKSLGNTIYVRSLKDRGISPVAYRYWVLTGHYRSPMNATWEALEGAQTALFRLHKIFSEELGTTNGSILSVYQKRFHTAINIDIDTPTAIAVMWEMLKDNKASKADKRATLLDFDQVLGLSLSKRNQALETMLDTKVNPTSLPDDIKTLLEERKIAREQKDWAKSDELRDTLKSKGFEVTDTPEGQKISRI